MAKKKERSKVDPNAWMNTYSDMVTLLMCFFVLLYAASTPDETKWQYIFQNFTSSGKYINPFVMDKDPNWTTNPDDDTDGNSPDPPGDTEEEDNIASNTDELPSNFNDLSNWLSGIAAASAFSDDITVEVSSSGSITIRFTDSVLFEPNSAVLTADGRSAISQFLPGIKAVNEYIGRITVAGHTAQGISEINDWDLSGGRASSVIQFMDYRRVVESEIYKLEAYAQYQPIADNDTEEGRRQNRRVELTIMRNDNNTISNAVIQDILKYDHGIGLGASSNGGNTTEDIVAQIKDNLENKYNVDISSDGEVLGSESGPTITQPITGIPDSAIHEVDEDGNIITDTSGND